MHAWAHNSKTELSPLSYFQEEMYVRAVEKSVRTALYYILRVHTIQASVRVGGRGGAT